MPISMALRFRDLVEETIKKHKEIIDSDKDGYVWWGWWNKPNEKIPRNTFAEFKRMIAVAGGKGIPIFLVDSGSEKLYIATLAGIDEADTEDPKQCDEPTKTPGYYGTAKYKAWFKLTAIEEAASPEEIRKWSYDEVKEFLADPDSERFQDKRVYSIQEMLNRRHRTIYFLKPYEAGHEDNLVESQPPVSPANFITEPIVTGSNYVIQLSDVHFGRGHHGFSLDLTDPRQKLSTLIADDLQGKYGDVPPAAVVLSGDLTWQGSVEEFGFVRGFIEELKSLFALTLPQFVVIPGNHDIQWADQDPDNYSKDMPVGRKQGEAEVNYREFYKQVFGLPPNEFLSMGRRFILGNYVPLDIVGVNSALMEQKKFYGYGFVSREQLKGAAEKMGWDKPKPKLMHRMLALHHHVTPVSAVEELKYEKFYSLTLDAGQLTYMALDYGVDLIVHGHMHQPFASAISRAARNAGIAARTLGVHGAGSAGVKRDHTGDIGKNSYSIIEFGEDSVTVDIRSWSENVHGFGEDWKCVFVPDGDNGLRLKSS
jgi:predicted phosphodiesterase